MSVAELYELYFLALEAVDIKLEFLISISFAVVVAAFLGSDRLSRSLYVVIGVVYSVIYATLVIRMSLALDQALMFHSRLIESGEQLRSVGVLLPLASLGGLLVYGSTIGFLIYRCRKEADE